jgi:tetratricopeptide (TPR) repeat protein
MTGSSWRDALDSGLATSQAKRKLMKSWRARLQLILLAIVVLFLVLTPYPQAFAANMHQAETLRASREYSAAIESYRQASLLDPESPLPWLKIGEVLLLQHQFASAASALLEAEQRGGAPEAVLGLGESRAGRGDWAGAVREWLHVLTMDPEDPRVYVVLGRASVALGQFDQAQGYLTHALQLAPSPQDAAIAHGLLGRLLVGEDISLAEDAFREAGDEDMLAVLRAVSAEQDPARQALLWGIAFLQRGELALARHHFERAVALAPGDAEALAYLAHTLDQQGETVAAMELLEQALTIDEHSALVHYFLGTHHRLVGNLDRAQDALWQALLEDPENAALRAEMGATLVDQGDYPAAEEWYVGAADAAADDVDFQFMLVHFYLDHLYRVPDAGLSAAQTLMSLAPDDPRAYDLLGWAYHLSGQQGKGVSALTEALNRDPDLVSAHFHLGSLFASTGQVELARQHLQRAADLDTDGYYRERAELILKDLE